MARNRPVVSRELRASGNPERFGSLHLAPPLHALAFVDDFEILALYVCAYHLIFRQGTSSVIWQFEASGTGASNQGDGARVIARANAYCCLSASIWRQ